VVYNMPRCSFGLVCAMRHEMPPRVHFQGTVLPSSASLSWKHGELQSVLLVMMSQRV